MTDDREWKVGDYIHLERSDHVALITRIESIANLDGYVESHIICRGEHGTQAWLERLGYTKLGSHKDWRVFREWDSNVDAFRHILVEPSGRVNTVYDHTDFGRSEAEGLAATYNLNPDRAEEFRKCPYCKTQCPWCS
jgi:hypothetical protein